MEVKQINQLMVAMGKTGIKKLVIEKEGIKLELEREELSPMRSFDASFDALLEENPMRQEIESHHRKTAIAESEVIEKEVDDAVYVTSPMVGSVYYAPSPNDPAFVKPGDRVEKNSVVCIIEAMKVMNEVKAGVAGIISEPLVENGHPIEFGTKLFRITQA